MVQPLPATTYILSPRQPIGHNIKLCIIRRITHVPNIMDLVLLQRIIITDTNFMSDIKSNCANTPLLLSAYIDAILFLKAPV